MNFTESCVTTKLPNSLPYSVSAAVYSFLLFFVFQPYIEEICNSLRGRIFDKFIERYEHNLSCVVAVKLSLCDF